MTKEELAKMIRDEAGAAVADKMKEAAEQARVQPKHVSGLKAANEDKEVANDDKPKYGIARAIRYLVQAKGISHFAADLAEKAGDKQVAKALGESTQAGGGAMIQGDFAQQVIDLLYARTAVRGSGVPIVPMPSGSLTMAFGATGATASYVGENTNITKSEPTFGQLHLSNKKLAALVPVSNDLMRDASGKADQFVMNDLAKQMAVAEDVKFIRGAGTQAAPKGLYFWANDQGTSHVFARTKGGSTSTLQEITADLSKMVRTLEDENVAITKGYWLMAPKTKWALMSLRDGNGNFAFRDEMVTGKLMGFPFASTTSIPTNLGGGSESELYFYNADDCVIADNLAIQLEVFPGGAYHDGSNVVSGISQDQTIVRAIALHDFGARLRGKEVAVLTTVDWA